MSRNNVKKLMSFLRLQVHYSSWVCSTRLNSEYYHSVRQMVLTVKFWASRIFPQISLLWEFTFSKFRSHLKGTSYVEEIQENLTGQLRSLYQKKYCQKCLQRWKRRSISVYNKCRIDVGCVCSCVHTNKCGLSFSNEG